MKTLFITFIMFIMFITNVRAASEFSSSYDFTYEVLESGLTKVTQQINLTNLTTNYYASEYSLTFGTDKITEIKASDNFGPLKLETTYPNATTAVHVNFNDKVLGVGKTLKWQLTYNSSAIANQQGRIWEINIPKAFKDDAPTSYNVKLLFPAGFGKPTYINPASKTEYFWTKDEGAQDGIILAFGDWQGYHFIKTYNLKNENFIPEIREIVLPKTTNSQEIILESFNPKPQKISSDQKGDWLAQYFLWPKQNLEIKVSGYAKVFTYPFLFQGLIQSTTGQIETNFVSQIPEDLKNKFIIKKEISEISLWQKIWKALFQKP